LAEQNEGAARERVLDLPRDDFGVVIPGTSSLAHLQENLAAGRLTLSAGMLERLDAVAATKVAGQH
jgi:aryl-alcohol dehydrogenase-like predicted oxidoreductase